MKACAVYALICKREIQEMNPSCSSLKHIHSNYYPYLCPDDTPSVFYAGTGLYKMFANNLTPGSATTQQTRYSTISHHSSVQTLEI
jgi:hypothetical protein